MVGPPSSGCAAEGANPDGALAAEMALNMLDTRARARELPEGRNIFGIEDANSEPLVRNLFFDIAEAQGEIDIAVQQYQSLLTQFNGVVGQTRHDVFDSRRQHAYATALPANDPSYRMVRDSRRLELAEALETASRLAYLAGRRGEYEYTARLSASNFRISDIYKARTANDILLFLQNLDAAIASLPGAVKDADSNQRDLTISVAQHILSLSDAFLKGQGIADTDLEAERARRFRQWAAQNTQLGRDGKPQLVFSFNTSAASNGLIGQVRVSQSGQVGLTSYAGCLLDYRLIPPAALLGLEYASSQPTDVVAGAFNGDINGQHGNTTPGYSTPVFLGRPLAANEWQVVIMLSLSVMIAPLAVPAGIAPPPAARPSHSRCGSGNHDT